MATLDRLMRKKVPYDVCKQRVLSASAYLFSPFRIST